MTGQRKPHPIDIRAGQRLRERRTELNITQQKLAATAGITFQQIQKYENATNRMSASRLYELSEILYVPPEYFFQDSAHSLPGQTLLPKLTKAQRETLLLIAEILTR